MATRQSVLFSWEDVERLPELKRLSFVLDNLPDGDLVAALERINARLDGSFRFENHFVRGKARMRTRIGLALAVMMALALGAPCWPAARSGCALWWTPACRSRPDRPDPRLPAEPVPAGGRPCA